MTEVSEALWIDVGMWTGLTGRVQPFTEIECVPPEHNPDGGSAWRVWGTQQLHHVAEHDGWQSGRYHFDVQRRDPAGRVLDTLGQGVWDWSN